jgi:methionyl-tRNA formyltransferase
MNITVLCTDPNHAVVEWLRKWIDEISLKGHSSKLVFDKAELIGGDILFLVSCSQIVAKKEFDLFRAVLVLHASNLPEGRGWSPHIWSILEGKNRITVSLLEAALSIDTGVIWLQKAFHLEGHELLTEINNKLFAIEIMLMNEAIEKFNVIKPVPQVGIPGKMRRKRSPEDSRLDPNKTITEQFNLLRVADSQRYPSFFEYLGKRFIIRIEKDENDDKC